MLDGVERGGGPGRDRTLLALTDVMRQLKRRVGSEGLDPATVIVLHSAACAGAARVSELAAAMGLDASTVSRHVKNLEEGGYLQRSPDPQDGRASRISLSPHGAAVLEQARAARSAVLDEATAGWAADDREALVRLLERLAADVAGRTGADVPGPGARRTVAG